MTSMFVVTKERTIMVVGISSTTSNHGSCIIEIYTLILKGHKEYSCSKTKILIKLADPYKTREDYSDNK